VLLAAVLPTLAAAVYFVGMQGNPQARTAYVAAKVVQFTLPLAWLATAGVRISGLLGRPSSRGVLQGLGLGALLGGSAAAWYFAWLAGSPLALEVASRIESALADFRISTPFAYLGMSAGLSLVHSFLEEYYWRWFVFQRASRWLPFPFAVALASAAFASHHLIVVARYLPPERFWILAVPATAAIGLAGALWCWLFRRSGNLLAPWASHLVVDAVMMGLGALLIWG
jgi:membrane protease YdiL (CAAX protease family)